MRLGCMLHGRTGRISRRDQRQRYSQVVGRQIDSEPSQIDLVGPGRAGIDHIGVVPRIAALYCRSGSLLSQTWVRSPSNMSDSGRLCHCHVVAAVEHCLVRLQRRSTPWTGDAGSSSSPYAARVAQERPAEVHATWSTAAGLGPGLRNWEGTTLEPCASIWEE